MLSTDIGVDLGTSNVLISVRGKGIVVNQPSVVAYEVSTKKVIAIGTKAKKMIGKTPENIEVVRPLSVQDRCQDCVCHGGTFGCCCRSKCRYL